MAENSSLTITPAVFVQVVPTVTAAAYSSGQCVGGLLTFNYASRNLVVARPGGLVRAATAAFASGVVPSLDLVLFAQAPTASTLTDHVSASIVAADLGKVVGVIHLTDPTVLGSTSVVQAQGTVPFSLPLATTTLYGAIIARASATLTSTSDMTVTIQVLQH